MELGTLYMGGYFYCYYFKCLNVLCTRYLFFNCNNFIIIFIQVTLRLFFMDLRLINSTSFDWLIE